MLAEITAIERDRARIAYDLHDELGPVLSAIKLKINIFELTDAEDKIQIGKINDNIDKVLTRMREISYDLMPGVLTDAGLATALREYINSIDRHILQIDFAFPESVELSEQSSINIYRIVQEITHNTIKHAKATKLEIYFRIESNKLILSFKDNGIGFQEKEILHKNGLGLKSLQSRAQLMNGRMFLENKKGIGTEIIFEIPC